MLRLSLITILSLLAMARAFAEEQTLFVNSSQIWQVELLDSRNIDSQEIAGWRELLQKSPRALLAKLDTISRLEKASQPELAIEIQLLKIWAYGYLYESQGLANVAELEPFEAQLQAEQRVRFLIGKGLLLANQGSTQQAKTYFDQALAISQLENFISWQVIALNSQSWLLNNTGHKSEASGLIQKAYDLALRSQQPFLLAYTLGTMHNNQNAQEFETGDRFIKIFESLGYDYHVGVSTLTVGQNFIRKSDLAEKGSQAQRILQDRAKPYLERAYQIAKSIGDTSTQHYAAMSLAKVAINKELFDQAKVLLTESLGYFYQAQELMSIVASLNQLKTIFEKEKQTQSYGQELKKLEDYLLTLPSQSQNEEFTRIMFELRLGYAKLLGNQESQINLLAQEQQRLEKRNKNLTKQISEQNLAGYALQLKEEQNRALLQERRIQDLELQKATHSRLWLVSLVIAGALLLGAAIYMSGQRRYVRSLHQYRASLEQKNQLEGEKHKLEQALQLVNRKLLQADKLAIFGTFVASIAHDLNNPSQSIKFQQEELQILHQKMEDFIRVLLGETQSEQARQVAQQFQQFFAKAHEIERSFHEACQYIIFLTQAIRNQTRFDQDFTADVGIADVLQECLMILKSKIRHCQLEIKDPGQALLDCRRSQLGQIFLNLLGNALDAVEALPLPRILVSIEEWQLENVDGILIRIEDNGAGIPAEVLPRLEEPFFTTKEIGKGTGLGLAITRKICQNHAGTLQINSRSSLGGAEMCVWLPRRQQLSLEKSA